MLIFGLQVVYFTLGKGVFHCPNCGGDREYRRRQGRNFFSLFFIPVIPLNKTGDEFVQCGTCKGRWHVGILEVPTTAQLAAVPALLMRLAAAQALRAGDVTHPAARDRAVAVVRQAGDAGYGPHVLDGDLGRPFDQVRAEMAHNSGSLAPEARENILRAAAEIALTDGPLSVSEEETLHAVGADLGLTRIQIGGVISLARQSTGF
ncbi:zinc-ribbon domain-containing protein [Actinomadura kijaniata]|uniref:zinc-ribbon domain-containing protein n=1 Tax=Actinomadura kijaniata TaxID=46161 RepID=UPI000B170575|nr:zinc-ribbon domain-containing protein [Actinomadura kijaniata]